jgi:hypothetical protein
MASKRVSSSPLFGSASPQEVREIQDEIASFTAKLLKDVDRARKILRSTGAARSNGGGREPRDWHAAHSTGFVLGYHGCDRAIAERLVGGTAFKWSRNQYDWLGWGAYFWENDPVRALQWARLVGRRTGRLKKPGVVGAIIDLGLCLDLTTQSSLDVIRTAYQGLAAVARATGARLPENTDELRRPLDCAVLNYLYESMPEPKFQTVRGVFIEGKPLYPGAWIRERTHVQVAVRDLSCIKGVFRVSPKGLVGAGEG